MAVTLRLLRLGKKNNPVYRIVAVDRRSKRNGKYIEIVGSYNPTMEPFSMELNQTKFDYWSQKGAIISEGLRKLLKNRKKTVKDTKPVKKD